MYCVGELYTLIATYVVLILLLPVLIVLLQYLVLAFSHCSPCLLTLSQSEVSPADAQFLA